jgi:hypothetical protein
MFGDGQRVADVAGASLEEDLHLAPEKRLVEIAGNG